MRHTLSSKNTTVLNVLYFTCPHPFLRSAVFSPVYIYSKGFFTLGGSMLAAMLFWWRLSNLLFNIQSLMQNHHGKLHDWATRPNDKTLLSKWVFISANVVRFTSILQQMLQPFKVDSPTFRGQVQDDQFGKQSANTRMSKECQIGQEHCHGLWKCAREPKAVNSLPCTSSRPFSDLRSTRQLRLWLQSLYYVILYCKSNST